MSAKWDTYRVHRQRGIIDQNLKKILFKESNGKPYQLAIDIIGDLIQFYSIIFRFLKENPLEFGIFIKQFNASEQIDKGFTSIHYFVKQFDKSIPLVKFGEELD